MKRNTIVTLTLILIVVILIGLYSYSQSRNLGNCIPEEFYLEIDVEEKAVSDNLTVNWQFHNYYAHNVSIVAPKFGSSFDYWITAENGTRYQYAGPITFEVPPVVKMQYGEIRQSNYTIEFTNYTSHSGVNYTNWKNAISGESWFFQPGSYEIFCTFESNYGISSENLSYEGKWISNTINFVIN